MIKPTDEAVDLAEKALAIGMYGMVHQWVQSGVRPAAALRFAAFAVIEDALGRQAVDDLGLPESTAREWRRHLRAAFEAVDPSVGPEAPTAEVLNRVVQAMVGEGFTVTASE